MSSMTATLAPAQASTTPLTLAVSSNSFWDSLNRDEQLASINAHRFRKFGKKTGWFPNGAVLKIWSEKIYPTISTIINDAGNYERIFGKHNKEVTRPCWLYMVGEGGQWETARPTIVALCSKTRIAQRICDLLRNIECMKILNLGFDYMAHKENIMLVTGEDNTTGLPKLPQNLCGLQVLASTYPPSLDAKWRRTTAGGALKINEKYYCLTVAHAFHLRTPVLADGSSDSSVDQSESSDCSDELDPALDSQPSASVLSCPPEMLDNLDLGLYLNPGSKSSVTQSQQGKEFDCAPNTVTDVKLIAQGRTEVLFLQSLLLCTENDWALLPIEDRNFFKPNVVQTPSGKILSPQRISPSPPDGKVIVAAGISGVFESTCPGIIGGLLLPDCLQMIDVWTIDSLCCTRV
jgi:hypothetical protein